MMEILPFLTSPMGGDLPMSLVLSCSPGLVLHIFRTRASVSIGLRIHYLASKDRLQPYIETIEHTKTTVLAQETVIQQQNQPINHLTSKINKLGSRIEEQEQYSRRTSLRFNNVKAPTNDRVGSVVV
jgi:uncharacterized coiled-coil protein SlyX